MTDLFISNRQRRKRLSVLLEFALLCSLSPSICAQTDVPAAGTPSPAQVLADARLNSARLMVGGEVEKPLSLSLTDLGAFPRTILQVMNQHEKKNETYQGVPLAEILKRAGVPEGEQLRGAAMATYVRVDGADGYSVIFSLAELDSGIGGADVLVADTLDGQPIPENLGPLRLVAPHDKRPARWVRMLRSITVVKVSR
jgi:DMSO/TMAO reductase YedYZ molybdopterin-dependent catalytic subunit